MKKKKNLYLFTTSFPFGYGEAFLEDEVPYLNNEFNLTIIPSKVKTETCRKLPKSININTNWAKMNVGKKIIYSVDANKILSSVFFHEYKIMPKHITPVSQAFYFLYRAISQCNWFLSEYKDSLLQGDILYSYWLFSSALCIGLIKDSLPYVTAISRAHSFDLYENRSDNKYSYIPFRNPILRKLDKIFAVSNNGREYLRKKYPQYRRKFFLSRLGVRKSPKLSPYKKHNYFRIVSCSNLITLKRVSLIISALCSLKELNKKTVIEWNHFGDGPLKELIVHEANVRLMPINIKYNFLGYVPKKQILNYYENNIVDVFVNVSESEGIPVSIMEALSYGIPIIATNVGGTSEIVDEEVGLLLNAYPSPMEIACALFQIMKWSISKNQEIRQSAFKKWIEKIDSQKNYLNFINDLNYIAND